MLYNKFFSPHLDHGWPPWPNANFLMRFSFVPQERQRSGSLSPLKADDDVPWSGPALRLSHTVPGGFPALQLSTAAAPRPIPEAACGKALAGCWPVQTDRAKCQACEGTQQHRLKQAGCTGSDIERYCGEPPGGDKGHELLPPFWLNLNNQGYPSISALKVQITRARIAGLKLLALVLDDVLAGPMQGQFSGGTHAIFDLIAAHHPTAKVLVRWYLTGPWDNSLNSAGNMVLQNISDPQQNQTIGVSSPTAAWAQAAAANLSVALANLDAAFPGN